MKAIKKVKELKKDGDAELLEKLSKVTALFDEEKALKAKIKEETSRLEALSKTTIENLTDDEVLELLEMKWIASVTANLKKLPGMTGI